MYDTRLTKQKLTKRELSELGSMNLFVTDDSLQALQDRYMAYSTGDERNLASIHTHIAINTVLHVLNEQGLLRRRPTDG